MLQIIPITTPFIFGITVNCYLLRLDGDGFILIDTAKAGQRRAVEAALAQAGCTPGKLRLIILTHGDFDHCGNAAYLRSRYNAPIALHHDDLGMVEQGDMLWNRKQPNIVIKTLMSALFRLSPADRFTPDVLIKEGDSFGDYGFDARVIALPGHSRGSVGILASTGDCFCGDLLANTRQPGFWNIMDDKDAARRSLAHLRQYPVSTVYPGHGSHFPMAALTSAAG